MSISSDTELLFASLPLFLQPFLALVSLALHYLFGICSLGLDPNRIRITFGSDSVRFWITYGAYASRRGRRRFTDDRT